jgi:hypothetical protein
VVQWPVNSMLLLSKDMSSFVNALPISDTMDTILSSAAAIDTIYSASTAMGTVFSSAAAIDTIYSASTAMDTIFSS